MKPIVVPAITFVIGIVVGVGVMAVMLERGPNQTIAMMEMGQTSEQAIIGTLLYQRRFDDCERIIESGFSTSLNNQMMLGLSKGYFQASQSLVRGYYDYTKRPIPSHIEWCIAAIPKGKGTDVKRLADAVAKFPIESPPDSR